MTRNQKVGIYPPWEHRACNHSGKKLTAYDASYFYREATKVLLISASFDFIAWRTQFFNITTVERSCMTISYFHAPWSEGSTTTELFVRSQSWTDKQSSRFNALRVYFVLISSTRSRILMITAMLYVIVEKRYTAETLGGQGSGIVVAASSTCNVQRAHERPRARFLQWHNLHNGCKYALN